MTTQVVPDRNTLERYLAEGLTQAAIAEKWGEVSGARVSRSAIAMAITRYGLRSAHVRPRYEDTLPWKVRDQHAHHNDARMLRLEGRRRAGGALSNQEKQWLTKWKQALREENAVIHYDPDTPEGFWWVFREDKDGNDIVRRPGT